MNKGSIETFLLNSSFQYYLIPFLLPFFYWSITQNHNPCCLLWIIHVLFPLLDTFCPLDFRNPSKDETKRLEKELKYKLPLYLSVFFDWSVMFYGLNWVYYHIHENSYTEILLMTISAGYGAVTNITVAHELLHKNNLLDKFLGLTTLSKNMYMHFYIEHVHGHHKRVATKEDPASARKNETLYQFLPRSIVGSWVSAWKYEEKRVGTKEFSIYNRMHMILISNILIPSIINYFYGWKGLLYFLGVACISFSFLEIINYVEHYGLERKEISPGVYEKVDIKHSWNAPHRLTNYLLFKLQRHSDHHENAYKPYQTLCSYDESPFLPHGYTVCLLMAPMTKIWQSVMNEIVEDYNMGIKRSAEELKARDRKVQGVLWQHGIFFSLLWCFEILGLTKLI